MDRVDEKEENKIGLKLELWKSDGVFKAVGLGLAL
jgi:hypothetical protein